MAVSHASAIPALLDASSPPATRVIHRTVSSRATEVVAGTRDLDPLARDQVTNSQRECADPRAWRFSGRATVTSPHFLPACSVERSGA